MATVSSDMSFSFLPQTASSTSMSHPLSSPTTLKRSRLVRTQTPVPDSFFSNPAPEENTLKAQTSSNTLVNRNMLRMGTSLFWDLVGQHDDNSNSNSNNSNNDDGDSASDNSDSDSDSDKDEDDDKADEDEDDNEQDGRERSPAIVDLNSSSSLPTASLSGSPPSFAMQASKKSKRVRIDASAALSGKRVRFDESRNTVHLHYRNSSISPPDSPEMVRSPSATDPTRPLVSALSPRRSQSTSTPPLDSHFELSLENTSQEVMDFASSLSRLMGGASANSGSQDSTTSSNSTFLSPTSSPSPLRSFAMFQGAPPSPVRPSFMSAYSPPSSSSLSSCWSPIMDDDEDDDENEDEEDDSMDGTASAKRPLSPTRPAPRVRTPTTFQSRRPRHSLAGNAAAAGNSSPRPRLPAMLKREASNASFLDSYPASLAPDEPPSHENSTSPVMASGGNSSSSSMAHATIATAVLNTPMSSLPDDKTVSFNSLQTSPESQAM
ncbi:hypothetical protein BGZ54_001027 [Gamsiella multidivaricata]|nr:hypothetical protein BGZ54_001027 [Gamsiella multidivaricata]